MRASSKWRRVDELFDPEFVDSSVSCDHCTLMRWLSETIGGLWQLFRLACKTRFRLRGKYWRWRYETAFGTDPSKMPSRRERMRAVLDYGRWLHRMRRLR